MTMLPIARATTLLLTATLAATAQDDTREGPYRRAVILQHDANTAPIEASFASEETRRFFTQGCSLMADGLRYEAARAFLETTRREPNHAMGWLGLALARGADSERAAEAIAEAKAHLDSCSASERDIVEKFVSCFDGTSDLTPDALLRQTPWLQPRRAPQDPPQLPQSMLRLHRVLEPAASLRMMVYECDGAAPALMAACRDLIGVDRTLEAVVLARQIAALPRHPRLAPALHAQAEAFLRQHEAPDTGSRGVSVELPRFYRAPEFELQAGRGGTRTLATASGKPQLLVFFLGFGCVHCVDQLNALKPKANAFKAAGIEIVTIGTDSLDQIKASFLMARENFEPLLPFPVLADPDGDVFRRYGAWDVYGEEALHGTYLIDGRGRVLWQDISVEPFMESDFLLAECQRLLTAER